MTLEKALNRLCKWRTVFAGWQLGTRTDKDPECAAVRDHREVTLLLRVEVSALTAVLIEKGVFTQEEYEKAIMTEAWHMNEMLEQRFPGFQATDIGMSIEPQKAKKTMEGWRP